MATVVVKPSNDKWVFEISALENSRPYPTKKEAHDAGVEFAKKMETAKGAYREALIAAAKADAPKPGAAKPKVTGLPGPKDRGPDLATQNAFLNRNGGRSPFE